jgi:hypothetical protein
MNQFITLVLGTMAILYLTPSSTMAQNPLPKAVPLNVGDSVKITSAVPPTNTQLARGMPVTIEVEFEYTLASQDNECLDRGNASNPS